MTRLQPAAADRLNPVAEPCRCSRTQSDSKRQTLGAELDRIWHHMQE